jgi:hypothetical protein
MDALRGILASPETITGKTLIPSNHIVSNALAEDPGAASSCLADSFFGVDSTAILSPFIKATRDFLSKRELLDDFLAMMHARLQISFWDASNPNFSALANAFVLAPPSTVFRTGPESFVILVARHLQFASAAISARLFESFLDAFPVPVVLADPDYPDHFSPLLGIQNTYTILSTAILSVIDISCSFDPLLILLRSLSRMLFSSFPHPDLESLYSASATPLKSLLTSQMPPPVFVLFLSLLAHSFNRADLSDYCFSECRSLLHAHAAPLDRIFAFNSLSRLVSSVSSLDDFTSFYMDSLIRDFDSANGLIYSSLRLIHRAVMKEAKLRHELSRIAITMMGKVATLSWRSKVKEWVFPQCLPYVSQGDFLGHLFGHLIAYSQDLTDSGFVSHCIRSLAPSAHVCNALVQSCTESVAGMRIDSGLVVLRPILRPMFEFQPDSVKPASTV